MPDAEPNAILGAGQVNVEPDLFEARLLRAIWRLDRLAPEQLAGEPPLQSVETILLEARISHDAGDVARIEDEYRLNDKMRMIVEYRRTQLLKKACP